jgi:ketosteroid isomerase-like protein
MLRAFLILVALAFLVVPAFATDPDTDALLLLHCQAREAHLTGNADLLASGTADHLLVVSRAKIHRQSREDVRKFFQQYLAETRYSMWNDVVPPEIRLSPDRKMAWMAVHIRARAKQAGEALDFESAWVATYEKNAGQWRMTTISSSIEDAPRPR